jgi:dTDP-glucose pyrophosphorylase/ubiquinone/menaquinone biosynthesis C-methylase UbiE
MLELAGLPLIQHSLEHSVAVAADEIVIVVGHLAEQIINRYGNSYRGVPIRYAIQREQRGLVHAIETAAPQLAGADFLLFLADEILLEPNHAAMLERYRSGGVFAVCGVTIPRDRDAVRKTYAILEDGRGRILRLIEKPRRALNEFQGTGNIMVSNRLLDYIESTPLHPVRGEKELPDLLQCAIDDGHLVQSCLVGGRYVNVNTPEDIDIAMRELAGMPRTPEAELMTDEELADAYAAADLSDLNEPVVAEFRRRFPRFRHGRLLDLGCGTADMAIRFANAFESVVVHGVDASGTMLSYGERAVRRARLSKRVTLEERYIPDPSLEAEAFDAVVSNNLLHHLADPSALWQTVVRCAKPSAPVMVADLHRPPDENTARAIVERHGAQARPVLQQSFFDSLRAAYTVDEIRSQLDAAGLEQFRVERIDEVHLVVWGDAPGRVC